MWRDNTSFFDIYNVYLDKYFSYSILLNNQFLYKRLFPSFFKQMFYNKEIISGKYRHKLYE